MPVLAIVAVGLTAYQIAQQGSASQKAKNTVQSTAKYNAAVDNLQADQIDADSNESLRLMRKDNADYVDRQKGQYVAAGIMGNSGSPLAVQAETAGRLELRAQHARMEALAKEDMAHSAAQAGIAYGQSASDQISMQSQAAALSGAAKIAGQGYSAYQTFGSSSKTPSGTLSSINGGNPLPADYSPTD